MAHGSKINATATADPVSLQRASFDAIRA